MTTRRGFFKLLGAGALVALVPLPEIEAAAAEAAAKSAPPARAIEHKGDLFCVESVSFNLSCNENCTLDVELVRYARRLDTPDYDVRIFMRMEVTPDSPTIRPGDVILFDFEETYRRFTTSRRSQRRVEPAMTLRDRVLTGIRDMHVTFERDLPPTYIR